MGSRRRVWAGVDRRHQHSASMIWISALRARFNGTWVLASRLTLGPQSE